MVSWSYLPIPNKDKQNDQIIIQRFKFNFYVNVSLQRQLLFEVNSSAYNIFCFWILRVFIIIATRYSCCWWSIAVLGFIQKIHLSGRLLLLTWLLFLSYLATFKVICLACRFFLIVFFLYFLLLLMLFCLFFFQSNLSFELSPNFSFFTFVFNLFVCFQRVSSLSLYFTKHPLNKLMHNMC